MCVFREGVETSKRTRVVYVAVAVKKALKETEVLNSFTVGASVVSRSRPTVNKGPPMGPSRSQERLGALTRDILSIKSV